MNRPFLEVLPLVTYERFETQQAISTLPELFNVMDGVEINGKAEGSSTTGNYLKIKRLLAELVADRVIVANLPDIRSCIELRHNTPIDADFLMIEEVACILSASVDTIRRIPKDDLPVYSGPGRRNIYLREDLMRYLKPRRIDAPVSSSFMDAILQ